MGLVVLRIEKTLERQVFCGLALEEFGIEQIETTASIINLLEFNYSRQIKTHVEIHNRDKIMQKFVEALL